MDNKIKQLIAKAKGKPREEFIGELCEWKDELFSSAWTIQELAECLKWITDAQRYLGSKEDVNLFHEDEACGGWYISKINQTLAEVIIEKSGKLMKELK